MKTFCYTLAEKEHWIAERLKKNRILQRRANSTVIGLIMTKIWEICTVYWDHKPTYHPCSVEQFVTEDFWVGAIQSEHMWFNTTTKGVLLDEESRHCCNQAYWKSLGYGYRMIKDGHYLIIPPIEIDQQARDGDQMQIVIPGDYEDYPIEID